MANTLEPRQTAPDSHKIWMRDGARLLWRVSSGWMLAWFAFASLVLFAVGNSLLFFLAVGLTPLIFDVHLVMLDRAATNKTGSGSASLEILDMIRQRKQTYIREGITRIIWATVLLSVWAGLFYAATQLAGSNGAEQTEVAKEAPPWLTLFGISWSQWCWVWIFPAIWQKHGLISFRPWLSRRLGASEDISDTYQMLARRKNSTQVISMLFTITAVGFLCLIFMPILLPIAEIWWVASLRCAYHDIFEDGTKVEEPAKVEIRTMVPA